MTRRLPILLFSLGVLLRAPLLFSPLWYDENYTLILARLPFPAMLEAIRGDVHPPLFYVLEWLVMRFTANPYYIRVLPFLFSLLCLPAFARVLEFFPLSPRAKTAALLLMSLAPMQIYYASEGRMYSLLCLLYLCGVWAVYTMRWPLVFVISTALAYTHNWGLFYAATLGALALCLWRARAWWGWKSPYSRKELTGLLLAFGGSAIAWLPWAVTVLNSQMTGIHGNYWIVRVTPGQVAYQIYQQLWGSTMAIPTSLVVTFAWLLVGIYTARRERALLMLAFAPVTLAVTVSVAWQPVLLFRAMIGVSPFILALYASAIDLLTTRRRALLAAVFIVPLFVISYGLLFRSPYRAGKLDYMDAMAAALQPGDVIVTQDDTAVVNLSPYSPIPIYFVPECRPAMGALSDRTRRAMGYQIIPFEQIPARRVWWIGGRSPLMPQCQADLTVAVTGGAAPYYVEKSDSDMIYSAMWLLEK